MRRAKLKTYLYQLMFAGCVSASFSTPVLAGQHYFHAYNGLYAQNGQFSSPYRQTRQVYGNYRFRPLQQTSSDYRRSGQRFIQPRYAFARPQYRQPYQRLSHHRFNTPAFIRQYGWEPAQPKGFRRGSADNFYANQSNDAIETSATPVYRTAPVSAQGFRYRTIVRNNNYVTFADRVKPVRPFVQAEPVQQEPAVVTSTVAHNTAHVKDISRSSTAGKSFYQSGNYSFRPDVRFQPERTAEVAPTPVIEASDSGSVMPVSYKLANAELPVSVNNSWNQWSFRPVDSTF